MLRRFDASAVDLQLFRCRRARSAFWCLSVKDTRVTGGRCRAPADIGGACEAHLAFTSAPHPTTREGRSPGVVRGRSRDGHLGRGWRQVTGAARGRPKAGTGPGPKISAPHRRSLALRAVVVRRSDRDDVPGSSRCSLCWWRGAAHLHTDRSVNGPLGRDSAPTQCRGPDVTFLRFPLTVDWTNAGVAP